MHEDRYTTRDSTYIGLGIATLIGGGFVIFQASMIFPIPGMKYILMAPYLSIVMYILLSVVHLDYSVAIISIAFGGIMSFINIFMGLAILLTGLLTQASIVGISKRARKKFFGASLYAAYTGLTALMIPKFMMGGVFAEIPYKWIMVTSLLCFGFGVVGTYLAKKLLLRIKYAIPTLYK